MFLFAGLLGMMMAGVALISIQDMFGTDDTSDDTPNDLSETGDATLAGGGGEDILQGGDGNDQIGGYAGNDAIGGGAG